MSNFDIVNYINKKFDLLRDEIKLLKNEIKLLAPPKCVSKKEHIFHALMDLIKDTNILDNKNIYIPKDSYPDHPDFLYGMETHWIGIKFYDDIKHVEEQDNYKRIIKMSVDRNLSKTIIIRYNDVSGLFVKQENGYIISNQKVFDDRIKHLYDTIVENVRVPTNQLSVINLFYE